MPRLRRAACALAMLLPIAACAPSRLVPAGHVQVDGSIEVDTPIAWNRFFGGSGEYWTLDGDRLNCVHFVAGVTEGEHVMKAAVAGRSSTEGPRFRPRMSASQIQQLVVDAFVEGGWLAVEAEHLRPARFGDLSAVRFEMRATNPTGLFYRSTVLAAEREQQLYLLLYIAPAEYYYERDLPAVERIFESAVVR